MDDVTVKSPQWTPGPWSISHSVRRAPYIISRTEVDLGHETRFVAKVFRSLPMVPGEMEANAGLIAAAPEMYEALKAAHDLYLSAPPNAFANGVTDPTGTIDEGEVIAGNIAGMIRAAIAKAEQS